MNSLILTNLNQKIFFDESGKKDDYPVLMGAISIPKDVYLNSDFLEVEGMKSHWVDFSRLGNMEQLLGLISKYKDVISINVINYNYTTVLREAGRRFEDPKEAREMALNTIYAKFPERIFYGLLRSHPQHIYVHAEVSIEKANEYENSIVKRIVEKDLNVQSIYRGENFSVDNVELKGKGCDVGLELTDLILGIMRYIIKNEPETKSNRVKKKTAFIIKNLKRNSDLYSIFSNRVSFYEWKNDSALKEIDFNIYLKAFLAQNHELWYK